MNVASKIFRLLLVSPWLLLAFLIIPVLVVLSVTLHVQLPLVGPDLMLVNNIGLMLLVACRLLRYLAGMRKSVRYGAACCKPEQGVMLAVPIAEAEAQLSAAGFVCDSDGGYAEKKERGYLGTTLMYAGLLVLLAVGIRDNLQQFSGALLDGMGPATNLNREESYRHISKGPLASIPSSLPKMQITRQYLPDGDYPMGATELSLISMEGVPRKLFLKPREPVSVGAYDLSMAKLVFEPQIVIKAAASGATVFDSIVKLDPLVQKRGQFSFYGLFQGALVGGGVYYQPEKSTLMVVISRGDNKTVADMTFQVDQQVEQGDYILSCAKMGQWSEIHVVRKRHKGLLIFGGAAALIGLLLRVAIRPQRVWLEVADEGCMVRAVGKSPFRD
ncbi:MAG: hypothetical protein PHY09_12390 [Desulfuromonadaceae bacterium]|nr:hypothetical protein [Desulfuromonadaceae bacterium]MDD5106941.1 hypothetical protein [Desulfuromonadaceae bacterium]